MASDAPKETIKFEERGPIGKGMHIISFILKALLLSLLISIVVEFVLIKFFIPEQGERHSAMLLMEEIDYLSDNFKRRVFMDQSSAGVGVQVSNQVYGWIFIASGFESFNQRYSAPMRSTDTTTVIYLKRFYKSLKPYALATVNVTQLFCVRLVVILMSLPAFILIAWAATVDGLVQRDLRRFTGAIERSWVHHYTKSWLGGPIVVLPAMIYLALPFNASPSVVFMPSFLFFGLMIFILITTYKKFV